MELDSKAFKALGSETRVTILKKLVGKPRSLSSLAQEMGISVQTADEHLRRLAGAGFVEKTRHAKWAYYSLTSAGKSVVGVGPNRQPVFILLSVSVLLFIAAGATVYWPSLSLAAPTGSSDLGRGSDGGGVAGANAPHFVEQNNVVAKSLTAPPQAAISSDQGMEKIATAESISSNVTANADPETTPTKKTNIVPAQANSKTSPPTARAALQQNAWTHLLALCGFLALLAAFGLWAFGHE